MSQNLHEKILHALHLGLIVSIHAEANDVLSADALHEYYVRCAVEGGAAGLRLEGAESIRKIRSLTQLPIIGFVRGSYADGSILITPELSDVEKLLAAGANIVAIDTTKRRRPSGDDGFTFFEEARKRFPDFLLADSSTFREGVRAAELGADFVSTTLSGYTSATINKSVMEPDYHLIHELSLSLTIPVIAEGRVWTPGQAALALSAGAFAVVVGSAITRPAVMTKMFVNALHVEEQA